MPGFVGCASATKCSPGIDSGFRAPAYRRGALPLAAGVLLALLVSSFALAQDAPVATIKLSSATAGSSLGGRLVEGVMSFRGYDYVLTLRGLEQSAHSVGSVRGLLRARDIEGTYNASGEGLRNAAGVTIDFDPPLVLTASGLEIEVSTRRSPKVTGGNRESGVE